MCNHLWPGLALVTHSQSLCELPVELNKDLSAWLIISNIQLEILCNIMQLFYAHIVQTTVL